MVLVIAGIIAIGAAISVLLRAHIENTPMEYMKW